MSFALTTAQIRNQTKTVTRRIGWVRLQPGTWLQPVVKAQGLKKGEHVETIGGPIRVVSVRRESLNAMTDEECALEGFPEMRSFEFTAMFRRIHRHSAGFHTGPGEDVTRIEFRYEEPASTNASDPHVQPSGTPGPRAKKSSSSSSSKKRKGLVGMPVR